MEASVRDRRKRIQGVIPVKRKRGGKVVDRLRGERNRARRWAEKQLDGHMCLCENCASARATLYDVSRDVIRVAALRFLGMRLQ